jgi:arylformamidase
MTLSPHVATHADSPYHVRSDWAMSDRLPLDAFIGPCTVLDVSSESGAIALGTLGALPATARLLLKTGRTVAGGVFPDAWPWLEPAAVRELIQRGLRLLGVDAPSVDSRESTTLDVHTALFSGGAFNIENLDLRHVAPGEYELFALPLAVVGLDAAPVRALLRLRA